MTTAHALFDAAPYEVEPLPVEPLPVEVEVQVTLRLRVDAAAVCGSRREEYEALTEELERDGYEGWERGSVLIDEVIRAQSQCMVIGDGIVEQPGGDVKVRFNWDQSTGEALTDRMIPRYPKGLYPHPD